MSQCESCRNTYVQAARFITSLPMGKTLADYGVSPPGISTSDKHMKIICQDCCFFLRQNGKYVHELKVPTNKIKIYGILFNRSHGVFRKPSGAISGLC